MRTRHAEGPLSATSLALGALLLLGAGYVAVIGIPEIMRYMRIRRM